MLKVIIKKLYTALITLFGVVTVVFLLFNILPGNPAQMMLGQNEDQEQIDLINRKYGFDKPKFKQYLYYLNDLSPLSFHSNKKDDFTFLRDNFSYTSIIKTSSFTIILKFPYLRTSFAKPGKKVSTIIQETLPNTFVLALSSISIAIVLGLILGVISALKKGSFFDIASQVISTLGMSLPSFFSSILFAWIFGFIFHEYTGLNMNGSLYEVDDYGESVFINWKNLILPSIVLGIRPIAVITQLMRNSLLDVLGEEYIKTAKAKGLSDFKIIKNHALKNALNPVITAVSGWFASMLAGAVFVEYIFGWNGIGKEIVNALNALDFPVITGAVLVVSVSFILINIIVDILYTYLDPKIKIN